MIEKIEGTVTRTYRGNTVEIPFYIDVESTGNWSQWGYPTYVLRENVDLLEALQRAAVEVARDSDEACDCGAEQHPSAVEGYFVHSESCPNYWEDE